MVTGEVAAPSRRSRPPQLCRRLIGQPAFGPDVTYRTPRRTRARRPVRCHGARRGGRTVPALTPAPVVSPTHRAAGVRPGRQHRGTMTRMDAVTQVPTPVNEPVRQYAPGSAERAELEGTLKRMASEPRELTMAIGGEHRFGGGDEIEVVQPHNRHHVLGTMRGATHEDARAAIDAATAAAPEWRAMSFDDRAAVLLKAADLLAGPWRATLNAATMLGQSKTAIQAEIDSACELIDFWRFNVAFARQIYAEQPISSPGVWNRTDHRPLEGFVYAITPFNFTAIAGNLPTAPALMGNTVVWKPAPTQQYAAHLLMLLLEEAGLPPGVINMVTGHGKTVSDVAMADPDLAGIHFTGSTPVFQGLW